MLIALLFILKPNREGMIGEIITNTRQKVRSNYRNMRKKTEGFVTDTKKKINSGKKKLGFK
tara:strand:+ start:1503 stop:1685 length:183 start_codon:yes stop_codon:yes gene_type:complete